MSKDRLVAALLTLAALIPSCATSSTDHRSSATAVKPIGLEGMGSHRRSVTTPVAEANEWFDQGLVLAFAFNHDEAERSFAEAARLDPDCAMAHWGVALVNGPNINNSGMDAGRSARAADAIERAVAALDDETPVERALVAALRRRYARPWPADRRPLDEAYAAAMGYVARAHPGDADVAALHAESLMDLQPWDLWTADGAARPGTAAILEELDRAMSLDDRHPLTLHLMIHAHEASPTPERALPAAERLADLVPGAGHLVHMPSHVQARLGRWQDAIESNARATEVDRRYRALSPRQGFYRMYMAHNPHFLAWAAMMAGQSALAMAAARDLIAAIPADFLAANAAFVDGFMTIEIEVLIRFGRWQEILDRPLPPTNLPFTTTIHHFARGIAEAALGRPEAAEVERAAFESTAKALRAERPLGNNTVGQVLGIARGMLAGEIAGARGDLVGAIDALEAAVRLEDALRYNESPDWICPVRHALGAFLIRAGRWTEAEAVYRADLTHFRENGWALFGLWQCLVARGDAEAETVKARFDRAFAAADVTIESSCYCVRPE